MVVCLMCQPCDELVTCLALPDLDKDKGLRKMDGMDIYSTFLFFLSGTNVYFFSVQLLRCFCSEILNYLLDENSEYDQSSQRLWKSARHFTLNYKC